MVGWATTLIVRLISGAWTPLVSIHFHCVKSSSSSKFLLLCSVVERESYIFRAMWVKDDQFLILGWPIPLIVAFWGHESTSTSIHFHFTEVSTVNIIQKVSFLVPHRFGTMWGWVNDERTVILEWTIPLTPSHNGLTGSGLSLWSEPWLWDQVWLTSQSARTAVILILSLSHVWDLAARQCFYSPLQCRAVWCYR